MEDEEWEGSDAVVRSAGTGIAEKRFRDRRFFEREVRALARLRHPHVVRILGWAPSAMTVWLRLYERDVMRALMAGEAVDVRVVGAALLAALTCCHAARVVHGDVKPENVLLARDGRVALCDFARSEQLGPKVVGVRRRFVGTRSYGAPEALQGWCSPAEDAWGAGCVLYVAAERQLPFEREALLERPPELAPDCWPCAEAAAVVRRLLEPDWTRRDSAAAAWASWAHTAPAGAADALATTS